MGTIEIDGKTIEIENMLAEQDHLYRRNAQLSVRLKYPGDVEPFIDAVNSNRVELTAKRIEKPVLLLERVDVILREETAGRGVYHGSCELTDGSIYVSLLAQNDEVHRFTASNVTEETFREMVRNAVAELEKKSGKLTLTRAKEILYKEVLDKAIWAGATELCDGTIYVSISSAKHGYRQFKSLNQTAEEFSKSVRSIISALESSNKLALERANEIVSEVASRFGFYYRTVFGVGPDNLRVSLINRNRHSEAIFPITVEDDFRCAVIGLAKDLQDMRCPRDWLSYDRIREIVRMECAKEGVSCTVTQLPSAEKIEVYDCAGSWYNFTWMGGSADRLLEEVRTAILTVKQNSNKLTPEKMWQIVQEVCATDGERPWMIKNDDGSIQVIHAYGHKWSAILSTCGLHIEKFREAVTNARDRRSAARINLTVAYQSHATATASWTSFTY